jgi:hypothetical protein
MEIYEEKYLHVDPDFNEIIASVVAKIPNGKVHFFTAKSQVGLAEGDIGTIEKSDSGQYLVVGDDKVRLDKIITFLGRPGPAYDEYDRYANVCFTCEDLGQFH